MNKSKFIKESLIGLKCSKMYFDNLDVFTSKDTDLKMSFNVKYNQGEIELGLDSRIEFLNLLISNIVVLYPLIFKENVGNSAKLRNSFQHGTYRIFIGDDNTCEILYGTNKIKLFTLLSDIKKEYNNNPELQNDRLVSGLLNNIRVLIEFLSPVLNVTERPKMFKNDKNRTKEELMDMSIASSVVLFNSLYQKNLENVLGPSLKEFNNFSLTDDSKSLDLVTRVCSKSLFNFSKLNLKRIITAHQRTEAQHCTNIYSDDRVNSFFSLVNKNIVNFDHIHHIRNAIAHGRLRILPNNYIYIIDFPRDEDELYYERKKNKLPRGVKPTYYNLLTYEEFLSLFTSHNINVIKDFLKDNEYDEVLRKVA